MWAHPACVCWCSSRSPHVSLRRDEDGVPVFTFSERIPLALEVTVTNMPSDPTAPLEDGDDAHAAQLLVSLPETLSYSGIRAQVVQVECHANQNNTECELGNPVKRDAKLKFYILLSTSGITIETADVSVDLLLSTISEQPDLAPVTAYVKVVIDLPLSVSGIARPHQLFFSGTVKGESAMTTVEEVGSAVEYEFTVTNPGKPLQKFGSAFLNIMWPHELANGKWLLYPTGFHFKDHPHSSCVSTNPLGLSSTNNTEPAHLKARRKGRSHPEEEGPIVTKSSVGRTTPAVAASERRKSLKLDCLLGSARCVLFQCPLHGFSGSAELKIQARLWNSTFLEVSVMIYPEHTLVDKYWISWWIIPIAVLAGILVLALLVCLLWKCGFFRRTEQRPQYETEYYRAHLQVQPSEAEKQASDPAIGPSHSAPPSPLYFPERAGFFRRAQYIDTVPQYHAVKIPRQDRSQFQDEKTGTPHKKEWVTHWSDSTS
ncbi:hypothetical protein SKAU_G00154820 [Synaphobranchus kaupii]|uniref:Integrin alpha-7 n=1 Tax=Synaphobranchus kaupii TaxID=118154 RepID=A0A9Q1FHC2_SYNKA|nr:hypothetical protein SKAU_G00154820 [Synaphobranchus kaupii]